MTSAPSSPQPRADRLEKPITAANCQGLWKPEALLFVANLPRGSVRADLSGTLNDLFSPFGDCRIKFNDSTEKPFAHVQYKHPEDASRAYAQINHTNVGGRNIRIEEGSARNNRTVYLYRSDRSTDIITEEFARELLRKFGNIEGVAQVTNADRLIGITHGVFVKFTFWQDFMECTKVFKHAAYGVKPDLRNKVGGPYLQDTRSPQDQRSIFIGGLPKTCSQNAMKADLAAVFGRFGQINNIHLIFRKLPHPEATPDNIAFIEFNNPNSAIDAVVSYMNNDEENQDLRTFQGATIRVETKQHSARVAQNAQRNDPRSRYPPARKIQGYNNGGQFNNGGAFYSQNFNAGFNAGFNTGSGNQGFGGGFNVFGGQYTFGNQGFQGYQQPVYQMPYNQVMMPYGYAWNGMGWVYY